MSCFSTSLTARNEVFFISTLFDIEISHIMEPDDVLRVSHISVSFHNMFPKTGSKNTRDIKGSCCTVDHSFQSSRSNKKQTLVPDITDCLEFKCFVPSHKLS